MRFRPFGDVLLTTSYLSALRDAYPKAQIDFLVFKPFDVILKNNPFISNVITWREITTPAFIFHWLKFLWRLRRERYNLVINPTYGTGSAEVVAAVGARYRLGWKDARFNFLYNLKADNQEVCYNAVRNLRIVRPLGIEVSEPVLWYNIENESNDVAGKWLAENNLHKKNLIMLSPGCKVSRRKWNQDRYGKLAHLLAEKHGYAVVVLWAPKEEEDARNVVKVADHPDVHFGPPTTLNEAAAFVQQSSLLICNTCGLMHIAVAIGTKTLTIFGPTKPVKWTAQGFIPGHCHLHNPEGKQEENNGFGITPQVVADKVCEMMDAD